MIYSPDFGALSPEEQSRLESTQGPWAKAIDEFLRGSLHMADGSVMEVWGGEAGSYENGMVRRFCVLPRTTIDINAVTAVALGGTTVELN